MSRKMFQIIGGMACIGCNLMVMLVLLATNSAMVLASPQGGGGANQVIVTLTHAPQGTAELTWNPQNTTLSVTLTLSGLQANSSHPAHIHAGDCSTDGPIVYPLNPVIADAAGNAVTTTTIPNAPNGIPARSWHVNVHSGPTLNTPAEALPITCGEVVNTQTSTTASQMVRVPLTTANAANQMASGTTTLTLTQGTLTVKTTVSQLVPGSQHAAHIHAGSCEKQIPGSIVYPLTTLTADAQGVATSTTIIPNVAAIPVTGWYINIHFSTDLSTQTGYDVIACGNVAG